MPIGFVPMSGNPQAGGGYWGAPYVSPYVYMSGTPALQQGEGFFGDLWDGFKSAVGFAKDTGIVSKALSLVPHPGAQAAARVAGAAGYGRRRRTRRMIRR
jgi:hypothetical protein